MNKLALAAPAFFLLASGDPLCGAADPRLAGGHRSSHPGARAGRHLCRSAQVERRRRRQQRQSDTTRLARAEMAGVIDGLTIVLVDGGKPESLPRIRDSLEGSGKSLQDICDAALKTVAPHTKGVWEEVAKGAVEPLVQAISDGIGAVWKSSVDKDKLATDTKKTKLEAARWPEFGDIAPR